MLCHLFVQFARISDVATGLLAERIAYNNTIYDTRFSQMRLGDPDRNPCYKHEFEQDHVSAPDLRAKRMRIEAALAKLHTFSRRP
jgi:hypothetical protein